MPSVVGLGEMMNVPGVLDGDAEVIEKIDRFLSVGKVVDGHAPGLSGHALNAYIASGISSDHESTVLEEAREKVAPRHVCHDSRGDERAQSRSAFATHR